MMPAGMRFWKASARKLYAVSQDDLRRKRNGPDRDDEGGSNEEMKELLQSLHVKVESICSVAKDQHIPIGLRLALKEAFMCKICHSAPLKPPMIISQCCRNVLGCQSCSNTWYNEDTLSKSCPMCRSPRGFSYTMAMPPLDELINAVSEALSADSEL